MLDTSGAGLHKRGYRARAGGAPIKETLAAAIVDVTRARLAPFRCATPAADRGPLLIEAALAAAGIAPGAPRGRFAAMDWPCIEQAVWKDANRQRRPGAGTEGRRFFTAYGSDRDRRGYGCELARGKRCKGRRGRPAWKPEWPDLSSFIPRKGTKVWCCATRPMANGCWMFGRRRRLYRVMGRVFCPPAGVELWHHQSAQGF